MGLKLHPCWLGSRGLGGRQALGHMRKGRKQDAVMREGAQPSPP